MGKHKVRIASRVRTQLLMHFSFLSRVSIPAAKRFLSSFKEVVLRIEDNPLQFPIDYDNSVTATKYRKALFESRYKVLFTIDGCIIWIDAVVDCRQYNI